MMRIRVSWICVLVLALSSVLTSAAFAQGTTSTLSGVVADNTGGVLPGAEVIVTNVDTGVSTTVKADAAGHYIASNLNPGNYKVLVSAPGFSPKQVNSVLLAVAVESHQDVSLVPGGASEVVNVQSTAPVTDTETSSVGSVIDNQQVTNIPLDQRLFYSLVQLSPAVLPPAQNSQTSYRGGFSVGGQLEISDNFIIDGYDNNDVAVGVVNFRPSVEGVQEFNLLTGVYPAEFGRVSGAQVIVSQQSGGNVFHGDAFLYLENSIGNASNFFTPASQKAALRRGQYGGTIGGPIKKDRTFFFGDFEGLALAAQIVPNATLVATNAQQAGLFACATMYDPSTQQLVPCTANPNLANGLGATVVNYSNLPVWTSAQAIEGRAIAAEYPVAQNQTTGGYQLSETRIENDSQFTIRIDHKISDTNQLSAEYNYYNDSSFEPSNNLCGSPQIPLFGCYAFQHSQLAGVTWTHTFTPHLLNEARLDFNRLAQPRTGQDARLNQSLFAPPFPGVPAGFVPGGNLGSIGITVTGYASIGNANLPQSHTESQYQFFDSVTWIKGHHTFKGGIDIHDNISENYFISDGRGAATLNSASIKSSLGITHTTGSNIGDLLLGYPYQTVLNPTDPKYSALESLIHVFFQDDWKVTPHLTFNLGIRYEYTTPAHEARNNMSTIVFTKQGSVANTANGPTQTVGVATPVRQNSGGFGKYLYHQDFNNVAPRFGFAYQPLGNDKTVVHGGFGVFFSAPTVDNGFISEYQQPPFRNIATYTTSTAAPLTFANPAGTTGATYALTGTDPNFATLYNMAYSFGFQQQLAAGLGLTVDYVGSQTRRITNLTNANQAVPTGGILPLGGVSPSTAYLRPYPNNQNLTIIHSQGNANYNSLQVKLQQQYRNGVSYLVAFTYAKSLDDAGGFSETNASSSTIPQNSACPGCEYGRSDFDSKMRLVLSPVVELPWGKGKHFLNHGGIAAALAGGWQLSSLVQVQTGRPFTVFTGNGAGSLSQNNTDRPNQVANPNTGLKTVKHWFNTNAFVPATTTITTTTGSQIVVPGFGNEQRNAIEGPGLVQWDATIQRNFHIVGRYNAALLFQGFDILNHPNFLNPTATAAAYDLGAAGSPNGAYYGQLTSANQGRDIQIAAKFFF